MNPGPGVNPAPGVSPVPRWRIAAAWTVLALLAAFAVVLVPTYYRNLKLQRSVVEITQNVENQTQPDDRIRLLVVNRARELDLPVKADNVHINRWQRKLRIDVGYFVRVAFPGYTVDLHFHPASTSQ
ncbi:MAG TPA: hypothetical protein VNY05_25225 [Candidatus Acidoferrales bacterium]|nr:hypothetical protein [Candidatus Acidoferrales bacterium]